MIIVFNKDWAIKQKVWEKETWIKFLKDDILPLYRKMKSGPYKNSPFYEYLGKCVQKLKEISPRDVEESELKASHEEVTKELVEKFALFSEGCEYVTFVYFIRQIPMSVLMHYLRESEDEPYQRICEKVRSLLSILGGKIEGIGYWFKCEIDYHRKESYKEFETQELLSSVFHPSRLLVRIGEVGKSLIDVSENLAKHFKGSKIIKSEEGKISIEEFYRRKRKEIWEKVKEKVSLENEIEVMRKTFKYKSSNSDKVHISILDFERDYFNYFDHLEIGEEKIPVPYFLEKISSLIMIGLIKDIEFHYGSLHLSFSDDGIEILGLKGGE